MIVITVQTYNGQAIAGLAANFDELGGTIGRAENNQLVLADPDRTISRVHAQVVFRNGSYAIIDRGSNAVLVNDQPLGNGREAPIRDGDQLTIGGYVLRVGVAQKAGASDPFADLFKGAAAPADATPPPQAAPSRAAPADALPLQALQPTRIQPSAPSAARAAPAAAPQAAQAIPEDWDPFATEPPPRAASPAPPANPFAPELPVATPARADSLDALFDLGGPGGDPLAHSPLATPLAQPNTAADSDPLRAFSVDPAAAPAPASDHASELNVPWSAPPLREAPVPAAPSPSPPLSGAVFSWNQPSRESKVVTLPDMPAETPTRPAAAVPGPAHTGAPAGALTQIIPRAASARAEAVPAAGALPASWPGAAPPDALRAAFADGLGLPFDRVRPLDPSQMRLVGQLLREATRGVVDLLVARAALKREMRTEVTMIVAQENNPLKFSPSVEAALQHLMGDQVTGFMPPAAAMRDAFDDLRAHQLGVVAGMRAALEGVLHRFDPAQLESKIAARRSTLASLLPAMRKSQLWELFTELYAQLSVEAAEDFHELFGKAFRQAYEAHIDALQQTPR